MSSFVSQVCLLLKILLLSPFSAGLLSKSPHLSLGGHCQSDTSELKPCIRLQMDITASTLEVVL